MGDAEFQKKCLGKMQDVATKGKTVLFVSHNIGAIKTLTNKCVYMSQGLFRHSGTTDQVVTSYLHENIKNRGVDRQLAYYRRSHVPDAPIKIVAIWANDKREIGPLPELTISQPYSISVEVEVYRPIHGAHMNVMIRTMDGNLALHLFSWDQNFEISLAKGRHVIAVEVNDASSEP